MIKWKKILRCIVEYWWEWVSYKLFRGEKYIWKILVIKCIMCNWLIVDWCCGEGDEILGFLDVRKDFVIVYIVSFKIR